MNFTKDAKYSDVFLCNGEEDWHDYYFISPDPLDIKSLYYCINRTGIEARTPSLFVVERSANVKCCEIFCIMSGSGELRYRGKTYELHENQLVILSDQEPHYYKSNPKNPLGNIWIEFYGSDSHRIVQKIIEKNSPILEGSIFQKVSNKVSLLQQKLMMNENYSPSLEIYEILLDLLNCKTGGEEVISEDIRNNFRIVEAYIDAHIQDEITNQSLADICGISLPYFNKKFKELHQMSPQDYIMRRRITKVKYALTQTSLSIEDIAMELGFCNASHLIRRFRKQEELTPAAYRKLYRQ